VHCVWHIYTLPSGASIEFKLPVAANVGFYAQLRSGVAARHHKGCIQQQYNYITHVLLFLELNLGQHQ
jgi:hypothetical protein